MVNFEILEENPMNMIEVRSELQKMQKNAELSFRANKTLEYLNAMVTLKQKDCKEIKKQIEELEISRIKQLHIQKLLDTVPCHPDEVKAIISAYNITLTKDNCEKIAKIFSDYTLLKQ